MKVLKSFWFTEMGKAEPIGIVIIENDIGEKKAYIGRGFGLNQEEDEKRIAERGSPFPLDAAKIL